MGFITSDMIKKESPIIVSQSLTMAHSNAINFDQTKHLSLSINDANNVNIVDPSIFSIEATFFSFKNDEFGVSQLINFTELQPEPCNVSHVSFDPSLYQSLGLKNQLCVPSREFTVEGYWDEDATSVLRVNLNMCNNHTYFNKCKTSDEISAFFQNSMFFNLLYSSIVVDLNQFENPVKTTVRDEFMIVDMQNFKKTYVYLKAAEIQTDSGWYFSSLDNKHDFMFDNKETDINTRQANDPLLSQFSILASKRKQFDTRRYQKIDDLFGNLSGTATFFIFICRS